MKSLMFHVKHEMISVQGTIEFKMYGCYSEYQLWLYKIQAHFIALENPYGFQGYYWHLAQEKNKKRDEERRKKLLEEYKEAKKEAEKRQKMFDDISRQMTLKIRKECMRIPYEI